LIFFKNELFQREAKASYDSGRGYFIMPPIKTELAFVMMAALQLVQQRIVEDNILEDGENQDGFRNYLVAILANVLKGWGLLYLDEDACIALDAVAGYWEYDVFDICRGVRSEFEQLS